MCWDKIALEEMKGHATNSYNLASFPGLETRREELGVFTALSPSILFIGIFVEFYTDERKLLEDWAWSCENYQIMKLEEMGESGCECEYRQKLKMNVNPNAQHANFNTSLNAWKLHSGSPWLKN